jgi:2-polyprenyl-3-methyl-5-hydroxy-6-metoxy-1,4-benzoquinol methylase
VEEKSRGKVMKDCLFCMEKLSKYKEGIYDTRFGVEGSFDIFKCNACGLVQLWPYPMNYELKSLYETYYNFGGNKKGLYTKLRRLFFESEIYRIWMAIDGDICFHSRRRNGLLLDIGCNEGQGLQIYKKNGFIAEGLEINVRAASEARKRGFWVFTDSLEAFRPERLYDVVVLSHVLEHSVNPIEMLTHVSRILNSDGQVWISCPNVESWQRNTFGRYWINWHVPFHITFFSATTLKSLLNNTGFEVIKIKYATPGLWIAQSIIATLFAKKGKKNYVQRSPILLGFLMFFVRFTFFPLLWLGNLLGRGDCLTIEAQKKQAIS